MDVVDHEDISAGPTHSRDPLKLLSLVYGYVPCSNADDVPSTLKWDMILRFLGFKDKLEELDVPEPEKSAMINFFAP